MRSFFRLCLAGVLASFTIAASGCGLSDAVEDEWGGGESEDDEEGQTEDPLTAPRATGPLEFANACKPGTQITIAAVGDVLLHAGLQRQAYAAGDGHHSLWKNVEPLLSRADITYGNLEGPCADGHTASGTAADPGKVFDQSVYSSYPQFNYHPSLIDDLKATGFDVVSTANNHALDRRGRGADRTIENLRAKGLAFTGTKRADEPDAPWFTMTEAKGVRVAFVACTFSTNGIPDPKNQTLSCYEDKAALLTTIRSLKERPDVDAVIVTPHWGVEYKHSPEQQEKRLAHEMLDAGAIAVFGGHPHVVQPWERHQTPDGRETFVIYSLGNFVSGQNGMARRSTLLLYVGLTKGTDGKVTINGVRHMPLTMQSTPSWTAVHATGDSLALTNQILGEWNRLLPNEALRTNPSCQ
jgi:poly-gamma-glutamate synthesis protein (capsule biosynthesis protein)